MGPAYRIVTPRLVIRCWDAGDAPRLKEAIDSSLDHLRSWLQWAAQEPESLEKKLEGFDAPWTPGRLPAWDGK